MARRRLIGFCEYVDKDYLSPDHLILLGQYLEQVEQYVESKGKEGIGRLIVNMPPRHGKSQTISKRWPAFLLGRHENWHVGLVAYNDGFAGDFSRANRELIANSPEYRSLFPNIKVSSVSSAVERWALDGQSMDNPSVVATGIGGALTGRGFQVIVIDDPIKNRQEADSQTTREHLKAQYKGAIRTRLEPGGAIVLVCTRWHEDDLAGWLLDQMRTGEGEKWLELNLPALSGDNDPLGRKPGEALWPERFDADELQAIWLAVGDYEWFAQYDGRPVGPGGQIFKREWWRDTNRYDALDRGLMNACVARWISFDTGLKDKDDNAFTACTVGELTPDYRLVICEVWRERLTFPELLPAIERFARRYNRDGKLRGIIIEDKASGTSAIQTLREAAEEWLQALLIAFEPSGTKEQRGSQAAVWCRNGCVLLPVPSEAAPWLYDFESELFAFPASAFKDQVDSFDQLIIYLEHLIAEGFRARNFTVERTIGKPMEGDV